MSKKFVILGNLFSESRRQYIFLLPYLIREYEYNPILFLALKYEIQRRI